MKSTVYTNYFFFGFTPIALPLEEKTSNQLFTLTSDSVLKKKKKDKKTNKKHIDVHDEEKKLLGDRTNLLVRFIAVFLALLIYLIYPRVV